jgi:hypothetical protein
MRTTKNMTDPQSRITQLERGIRRWRRAALALASVLALTLLGFGWLVTQSQIRAERARREAIQARDEAEARRALPEKELLPKAK